MTTTRTLDPFQSTLDDAFYVASCLCGASYNHEAHIYEGYAGSVTEPEPKEAYLVFRGDDARNASLNAVIWHRAYTVTRHPEVSHVAR